MNRGPLFEAALEILEEERSATYNRRWGRGVTVTVDLSAPPRRLANQMKKAAAEIEATADLALPGAPTYP